jgi:hypothetical protein
MISRSKSREVWACRGSGGNANRRDAVVGIVESRESHALPGVPELFQFPVPYGGSEWVERHRRRGTQTAIRKSDSALDELDSAADGVAQLGVCAPDF